MNCDHEPNVVANYDAMSFKNIIQLAIVATTHDHHLLEIIILHW